MKKFILKQIYFKGLLEELNLVAHLNLTNFIIPIRSANIENLSRIINNTLLNKLTMFNVNY